MKVVLLSIHVIAAIVLIGPVTAAASVFPRYARRAAAADDVAASPDLAVATAMHRIGHGYAVPAALVPIVGIGLAGSMGVLAEAWIIVSMVLTALAAVVLLTRVNPGQRLVLDRLSVGDVGDQVASTIRSLSMTTGVFALLWAVVVVLMIARPGSTTGV